MDGVSVPAEGTLVAKFVLGQLLEEEGGAETPEGELVPLCEVVGATELEGVCVGTVVEVGVNETTNEAAVGAKLLEGL